jgi:hypothetical protein
MYKSFILLYLTMIYPYFPNDFVRWFLSNGFRLLRGHISDVPFALLISKDPD